MIFSSVDDIYFDISEAHEIFYIFMKVLHQIGKKIHDMTATHEADFVESFDIIWERVCKDIFSMVDYAIRSEYACIKIHSYDALPSSNDDHQRASPHDLCLHHFDALMHDLGIHNIFTKSITKKLFFHLIQLKKMTCWINFCLFFKSIFKGIFSSLPRLHGLIKFCCERWIVS